MPKAAARVSTKPNVISFTCNDQYSKGDTVPYAFLDAKGSAASIKRLHYRNKTVINEPTIRLSLNTPFDRPVQYTVSCSSGWTRTRIIQEISRKYQSIYSTKSSRMKHGVWFDKIKQLQLVSIYQMTDTLKYGVEIDF